MSMIQVRNLTFSYDGSYDNIFENTSFEIDTRWRLGFVGRNGRGKTTFLRLLAGELTFRGSIRTPVAFDSFPFEIPLPERPVHAVLHEICPEAEVWQQERELSLLGVGEPVMHQMFHTLSHGERTKVMLAGLFLRENRFLLIDEPTNHLDTPAREKLAEYLKGKQGYILVSHDRTLLDTCADHILSINRAGIEVQKGNFSSWWENRQRQDAFELAENQRLQKEIGHLTDAARRASAWSDKVEATKIGFDPRAEEKSIARRSWAGEKSRKLMKRAKNIEARYEEKIEEKAALLKNLEKAEDLKMRPLKHDKPVLVQMDSVSVQYDGVSVCGPLGFDIRPGERVALQGRNGSGKSSLLRLISGANPPDHTGRVYLAPRLILSVVSQDTSGLSGPLRDYPAACGLDATRFMTILRKLDFSRVQFEKRLEDLSGGQKKKILLARSLCQEAHLYLWDEPLNFVDVLSRMQIEALILESRPTLLFVEHDAAFVRAVATRVVDTNSAGDHS